MVNWFEEVIADKIRSAKNHVILVPARNQNAPLDAVDIFDGVTGQFIVADVPEDSARDEKYWVRREVAINPNCPEEIRVAFVLEN